MLSRLAFLASDAAVELSVRFDGGGGDGGDGGEDGEGGEGGEEEGDTGWERVPSHVLAAAEWNAALAGGPVTGPCVVMPAAAAAADGEQKAGAPEGAPRGEGLMLAAEPEDGDYCALAWRAAGAGAAALVVAAAAEVTRPMSYGAEQKAPPLPAVMVPRSVGAKLRGAAARGGARLRLRVVAMEMAEEEEGLMADVVALAEAAEDHLLTRLQAGNLARSRPHEAPDLARPPPDRRPTCPHDCRSCARSSATSCRRCASRRGCNGSSSTAAAARAAKAAKAAPPGPARTTAASAAALCVSTRARPCA